MIHVLCVATQNKGYLEFLEASCKRYDLKLIKLKWGEEWKGFIDRIKTVGAFLKTLAAEDKVLFLDAYDTIIVRDPHDLEEIFPTDKITMALDNASGLSYAGAAMRFGTVDGKLINGGTYFGSVALLQAAFDIMEKMIPTYTDDQVLLTDLVRQNRSLFRLDDARNLAAICADATMRSSIHVDDKHQVAFQYKDVLSSPFVLHYTYDGDMLPVLKELGYDCDSLTHNKRENYYRTFLKHHTESIMQSQWMLIMCFLIVIVLIIVCWVMISKLSTEKNATRRFEELQI